MEWIFGNGMEWTRSIPFHFLGWNGMDKYLNYCTIAIFLLVVIAFYVLHKKDSSRSLREDASSGNLVVVKQLSYTGAYVMDTMGVTPFETFGSEWTQGNTGFLPQTWRQDG